MKIKILLALTLPLLFTACSNIGSTPTGETISFAGIVDGTATNPMLNGQKLVLSSASVTQDDAPAKASDLRPGMEIAGTGKSNGSEIEVENLEFEDRVRGQIDVINTADNSLDVVGIHVVVDASAKIVNRNADGSFTDITLAELAGDDYIEVHGVPRNDDSVLGMFIMRKTEDNPKVDFRMPIRDLDTTAKTFTYGLKTYTVDYSNAEDLRGNLVNNAMIRVRGVRDGNVIRAERVRFGNDDNNDGNDDHGKGKYELKGALSNLDSTAKTFTLLDFAVDYSEAKVEGTLEEGSWVEVKGSFDTEAKTVKATKVETKGHHNDDHDDYESGYERKGTVEAIDTTAMTITVAGVSYWADSATIVENEDSHIIFADIKVGDFVEVKYNPEKTNDGGLSYTGKIEIKTGDDDNGGDDDGDDKGDDD